jgi:DNA-binding PadR family transcriptional regulator
MPPANTASRLPVTAFAALGLLSFGPMSGYELKQVADRSIRHFYWSPAKSQIYAELRRLHRAGMVTEEHVEQETRPDKRVYQITDSGRRALASWLNSEEYEPSVFKSASLLKIFLGQGADPAALTRMLERHLEFEREKLDQLRQIEVECAGADHIFTALTVRAGILFGEAGIKWAEEALAPLRDMTERSKGPELRRK